MKAIVVGGGILGRLLAWELRRAKASVVLHDRGSPDQTASFQAAGMLAPYCELESSEPLVHRLGLESLEVWPGILASLNEPVFFERQGSIVVAHPRDAGELSRFKARLASRGADTRFVREVSGGELAALEPELDSRFLSGLHFPFEGQIDARACLLSLARSLEAGGVECHWSSDIGSLEALAREADWVIDCRGVGALGDLRDLRPLRGELLLLQSEEVRLHRPVRLLHPRYPLYLVPRPGGRFLVGATQIETEDRSPVSVRSAMELLSAAFCVSPRLGEARLLESWVGLRPAFPDHLPRICRTENPRLLRINGIHRHGFLAAPAIARIAARFIQGREVRTEDQALFSGEGK